jgi:hypothetical protein
LCELTPDTSEVCAHRVEATSLAALDSLRHHQPQHHVDKDANALEEHKDEECDPDPNRIQAEAFGQARAYTSEDAIAAAIEPLVVHALHVRPFNFN